MRDYERIVRALVEHGHEGPKVDFKEGLDLTAKRTQATLARLALAMANTDSDELDDLGYIIVGARRCCRSRSLMEVRTAWLLSIAT